VGNFTSFDHEPFAYVLQRLLLFDNDLSGKSAKIYRCTSSCLLWTSSQTRCRENGLKDRGKFQPQTSLSVQQFIGPSLCHCCPLPFNWALGTYQRAHFLFFAFSILCAKRTRRARDLCTLPTQ
ncbi:hypothetical protein DUNSADRAFT_9993, partial [Dunaliella salina]